MTSLSSNLSDSSQGGSSKLARLTQRKTLLRSKQERENADSMASSKENIIPPRRGELWEYLACRADVDKPTETTKN